MHSFKLFLLCLLLFGCSKTAPQAATKSKKKVRVALVLGAGGTRGLVHLGVLEVLEENKLSHFDVSLGSLIVIEKPVES